MRLRLVALIAAFSFLTQPVGAQCVGQDIVEAMPAMERQALEAQAHAQPYAVGNYWRATKGDQEITLIGTYHLQDGRHAETLARLAPALERAELVLVEAGPEEMAALKKRMSDAPELMVITDGPTLPERLSPEVWEQLSAAVRKRGVPPFMAAKMQPWYLAMLLSIPPCAMSATTEEGGLDALVIEAASARNLPLRGLEPYDTLFDIFGGLSEADQLAMVTSALALQDRSEDMSVTMANSYFREEGRLIWELTRTLTLSLPGYTPERVDAEFAAMEEAINFARNRRWIPVLTEAAEAGPVLAAFGSLHLSGSEGVLALLEAEGFTLERLAFR